MPKRGGRKRLRIVRSVRRKIRVSSYCVSRELKTLQLLRWLEKQPNRRLSQSIRAEGGSMPQGPVGAATVTASAAAVPTATRAAPEQRRPPERLPGMDDSNGSGGRALTIDQLEWMDSLYIDVIHSTTDLRGGIRKARALARRAWEDVPEEDEEGEDYEREGEEEEDDDVVTHKDVIYFPYGAVVFWGCSEAEEKEILSSLDRFMVAKVSDAELRESFDDMTFVYRHRRARKSVPLKNDEITLDTRDPAEKLAYSCALAQSAKLFVFEERLNNTVESTSKYPQMLAATGKIPLTEVQIGRLVGQVLCEQNEVNLHSDILDTPEYFWEEDAWEPAYEALTAYLDIPLRVDNLNTRLGILKELLDVLSTQSTNAHATRLEVIIIYLIFVEVAIELVWNVIIKDVLRLIGEDARC
ncbi:unnamed protein product [Ascophyllum nodosum]